MSRDPDQLPLNGRVRCRICLRYYQHGRGESRTLRHLGSRRHIDAAALLGIDPAVEHAERARCAVCGGVANELRRHIVTRMHQTAAMTMGVDPQVVGLD